MMARLEESEHGASAAAREWLMRASLADPDPAWVCAECGEAAAEWTAVCRKCAGFDSLVWRTPPTVTRLVAAEVAEPPVATLSAAQAAVNGIRAMTQTDLTVTSLQAHYAAT